MPLYYTALCCTKLNIYVLYVTLVVVANSTDGITKVPPGEPTNLPTASPPNSDTVIIIIVVSVLGLLLLVAIIVIIVCYK